MSSNHYCLSKLYIWPCWRCLSLLICLQKVFPSKIFFQSIASGWWYYYCRYPSCIMGNWLFSNDVNCYINKSVQKFTKNFKQVLVNMFFLYIRTIILSSLYGMFDLHIYNMIYVIVPLLCDQELNYSRQWIWISIILSLWELMQFDFTIDLLQMRVMFQQLGN